MNIHICCLSIWSKRKAIAFVEVCGHYTNVARSRVKPVNLIWQNRRGSKVKKGAISTKKIASMSEFIIVLQQLLYSRYICEEKGTTRGMDFDIIQRIKLSAKEIIQQDGSVVRRIGVDQGNRRWQRPASGIDEN